MPVSVIRWWNSERLERVLPHTLVNDPDASQLGDSSVLPAAIDPMSFKF
jgi:hypothetical protein